MPPKAVIELELVYQKVATAFEGHVRSSKLLTRVSLFEESDRSERLFIFAKVSVRDPGATGTGRAISS